ncbi:AbfB domain-containing protein [Ideonella sp. B508-1]|uniref:AbfB domain-containing protein n=1 Tax=Ideonella sp. B508-1 TaxID=137716 RepID=UPI0003B55448|nr:AbfB domain-containing protein [Ideonella sp. B508-1]
MVPVPVVADPLLNGLSIPADAAVHGMWSGVQNWPLNGLHYALLPNGKLLTYGTTADPNVQDGRMLDVWDPTLGFTANSHITTYNSQQQDSFCSSSAFTSDGNLLIAGGNGTNNNGLTSTLYNPATNSVSTPAAVLADARWYTTMLTLPDGRPLVVGGMVPYSEDMQNNPDQAVAQGLASMTPEVFENGNWHSLLGAYSRDAFGPDYLRASYPRAWVAPSGKVFGVSAERMWSLDATGNGTITIQGAFKQAPSTNNPVNVGASNSAVMYDIGKVLIVGGNGSYNADELPASNLATSIDINGATPVLTEMKPMANKRRYPNMVVLPGGQVVVTGGTTYGNMYQGQPAQSSSAVEIWDPATGAWQTGPSAAIYRGYHSSSILLPNGTILTMGGGAPGPVNNLNAEVYYPPQLFTAVNGGSQLAARPVIGAINGFAQANGATLLLDMASTAPVSQLVLIGAGRGTHSFNGGQRRIPLTFTQTNGRLSATLPGNTIAPPGPYQVVAINAAGTPSRGTIITLGMNGAPASDATLQRGTTYTFGLSDQPANALGFDSGNGALGIAVPSAPGLLPASNVTFVARPGLADEACVSLESASTPGQFLRHYAFRLQLNPNDGSGQFAQDATFCPEPGLAGRGMTLRSKNYPDRVIRQRNGELWVDTQAADTTFAANATFIPTAAQLTRNTATILDPATFSGNLLSAPATDPGYATLTATVPGSALPGGSAYLVRDGLANAACVSFESQDTPGRFLRHYAYRLQLNANDGSAQFAQDATFCPEAGLSGQGTTLRSYNYPDRVLVRHVDGQLWIDPQQTDTDFLGRASFVPWPATIPLPTSVALSVPVVNSGDTVSYAPGLDTPGLTFSWSFGDGSAATAFVASSAVNHSFTAPGVYGVTLTVRAADGRIATTSFVQAVATASTAQAPRASSAMALETRSGASARLWIANPDAGTVAVIDTANNARVGEPAVGASPRSVAIAPDGRVWVVNKDDATISIIDPATLAVVQTVSLARGSQPHGLLFSANGSAYLALEATGQLLKLDGRSGVQQAALNVGSTPRHLSITGDGTTVLVSRFITPPLPGEGTKTIDTSSAGAEVRVVDTGSMSVTRTIVLHHSDKVDNETQGSGIPNYLAAAVISPDGKSAWVPSKQDNIKRGTTLNGQPLNFQNTVRAISSKIDLSAMAETLAARVDHDNSSLGTAAVFHPSGAYLFVALETSRQVAVVDAIGNRELFKFDVGRAPQALQLSANGRTLYVQNFMDRTVSVIDLSPLIDDGLLQVSPITTTTSVGNESLSPQVLQGKQLFYDARDPRLARDSYMSCASCHADGGFDGRVWDLSSQGEGLRNTISLRGHAGMAEGLLHWSGNFDEVQDFEGQIRTLAGGTGLMSDADFNTGTRSQPLGDKKAGISPDLDALAAYVASLNTFDPSPFRPAAGVLSDAAIAGKAVFAKAACASCHGGPNFTNSSLNGGMRNIGTIKATSGNRLGQPLTGIDIPTLRGVWATAPYLHDGTAPTLAAAVQAHAGNTVTGTDLSNLVAYLQQIDGDEPAPATPLPNGVYRLVSVSSGKALSVGGGSTTVGTATVQGAWTGVDSQRWKITSQSGGFYTLLAQHSGQALDVNGCSTADGAKVQQWTSYGNDCQSWTLEDLGDGSFRVVNKSSGKVLDVLNASGAESATVAQWTWNGGANQRWRLEPVSPNNYAAGTYRLTPSFSTTLALDVAGASTAPGAQVFSWTSSGSANQRWTVIPTADGFFELAPAHAPTMRLQVTQGALDAGVLLQQGLASGTAAQRWGFERQSDGTYRLTNRNSALVLDVQNCSTANGANVEQWNWVNSACQKWRLSAN